MTHSKLTTNGRITIPLDVRVGMNLQAGDRIEFVQIAPGHYQLLAASLDVTALKNMFGKAKKTVSIGAMNPAHVQL